MIILKSRLINIILFVVLLIGTLLWIDAYKDKKIYETYHDVITKHTLLLQKNHSREIINTVYYAALNTLSNTYVNFRSNLNQQMNQLDTIPPKTSYQKTCDSVQKIFSNTPHIKYLLYHDKNNIVCGDPTLLEKTPENQDNDNVDLNAGIISVKSIKNNLILKAEIDKKTIHDVTKNLLYHYIHTLKFTNPDTYVWVNEIKNYQGGENYAIRRIHPNLKATEGMHLSTSMQDIKGGFPYKTELEGIRKNGEVFLEYYFKKKTSNAIRHKLSHGKLFEPFDWIIATGVYIDGLNTSINTAERELRKELLLSNISFYFIAALLTLIAILTLYKKERHEIEAKENELKCIHQQKAVKNYQQVLYSMLDLIEKRDTYTAGHTRRVAEYALLLAQELKVPQHDIDILHEAAMMHDIGKVATPDSILLKPGKLTASEYKIIQDHVVCSFEILDSIEAFKPHAAIVINHHERFDGKGYPKGLLGHEMNLLSHILILCDAFDAMTSNRIYKAKKDLPAALDEIRTLSGKQFAPEVVKAALPLFEKCGILPIEQNYLSNQLEEARVVFYYRDSLTNLYNYRYFNHVLEAIKKTGNETFYCSYFVTLKHFSQYNQTYGWLEGDNKLCFIADKLTQFYPKAIIFRMFGDDFLILNPHHTTITKSDLMEQLELKETILDLEIIHTDLTKNHIHNFDEFSKIIQM
ncbi:HD domain-containing phosphohydrolase [Sulfurospirillum sp. 1612]|uniref:HD domain-containing phosphohydrolase n=1 Tax=Sulfurospirillum sp. 1612 TaxID=3094835 RepID=UPI002F954477